MIVVVGAGITGLAVGLELERRGAEFVVLEAAGEPGGVMRSAEVDGRVLDWGPQRLRLGAGVERLVDRLGLREELVFAPDGLPLQVYTRGRLHAVPRSLGALLSSNIVGWRAKLRLLMEPLTAGPDPDERVAGYFRRKLGNEVYETIVAPLYGGLYASDPADMQVGLSLIHVLRELGVGRSLAPAVLRRGGRVSPPAACTFRRGVQTLPRAMAEALGDRVRLEHPVTQLRRAGHGWTVRAAADRFEADQVILTTPAPVTARLLRGPAPTAASAIGRLRYNDLGVVHVDAETGLRGLGFQVAFTEKRALRGVTFLD
ncbi:MAG TPA: protoporphyrinogen oxidase, partial [Alphaproteobacteria bacterium]|nr:protoporphyrinogen oxidase [Alphaproteobacteria bacterium]